MLQHEGLLYPKLPSTVTAQVNKIKTVYKFDINFGYNDCIGKSQKRYGGRPTILTNAEENEVVITCQVLQEIGYGLTWEMVEHVVMNYVRDSGRSDAFPRCRPSKDW